MTFEKDDRVVLSDKHSEHDGEVGTVTQKMETMFGDATYTVSFEDGQETGIPADALDAAEDAEDATDATDATDAADAVDAEVADDEADVEDA